MVVWNVARIRFIFFCCFLWLTPRSDHVVDGMGIECAGWAIANHTHTDKLTVDLIRLNVNGVWQPFDTVKIPLSPQNDSAEFCVFVPNDIAESSRYGLISSHLLSAKAKTIIFMIISI